MNIEVIGLMGESGSGKSIVATCMYNKYGYTLLSFSEPIKMMLSRLGLSIFELYSRELKDQSCSLLCGKTPRYAMQTLGTEWGRNLISKDLWCIALKRTVDKYISNGIFRFVIDDVRFHNEAAFIRTMTFDVKESYRFYPGIIRILRAKKEEDKLDDSMYRHVSETENCTIQEDEIIENNATVEDLQGKIDVTLANIKAKHDSVYEMLNKECERHGI